MADLGEATITTGNAAKVSRAWATAASNMFSVQAPTIVGGVVYYLHRSINTTDPTTLVAASTRTAQPLWQVKLADRPNQLIFSDGVTVSGNLVLIPFQDPGTTGAGLFAVSTTTHAIAWTRRVAADSAQDYAWSGHRVYADGSRAYVHLADNTLGAYRLSDGALLWTVRLEGNQNVGIALGAGTFYVGYRVVSGVPMPGLTAYDAATGKQLWTAPGEGIPVLAGGRVFSTNGRSLVAVNAAGCGKATCPALWTKSFSSDAGVELGAADASTLVVAYRKTVAQNSYGDTQAGVVARLSATSGAQQWSASVGTYLSPPVRGGGVMWTVNEYRTSAGVLSYRILGFTATGTGTAALAYIPGPQRGFPQTLAVGGGTVFDQTNGGSPGLVGYRVPGT
jgi:outer membrane protein assembly factor BamB